MIRFQKKNLLYKVYTWLPILALFISVFNEFDLNYLNIDYFSFNFPFILIFYFALKAYQKFDYFLVFLAGLFNDAVVGLPLGISSLSYIFAISLLFSINLSIFANLKLSNFAFISSNLELTPFIFE